VILFHLETFYENLISFQGTSEVCATKVYATFADMQLLKICRISLEHSITVEFFLIIKKWKIHAMTSGPHSNIFYQSVCSPFDTQRVLILYRYGVITVEHEIKDEILNLANTNSTTFSFQRLMTKGRT